MSSHHIIREKQEPALLVLGLDNFTDELLGQLLEWSPTLIATPIIAEKLNAYGIKIDWIIADHAVGLVQSDIKYLPVGNNTIITAALKYLIAHGYPSVNIVTDEFELKDFQPFANKINMVVFYHQQKIFAISSGFNKWKPAGERIQFLSAPKALQTNGLQNVNDNVFRTTSDGFFSLKFDNEGLFIAEDL